MYGRRANYREHGLKIIRLDDAMIPRFMLGASRKRVGDDRCIINVPPLGHGYHHSRIYLVRSV